MCHPESASWRMKDLDFRPNFIGKILRKVYLERSLRAQNDIKKYILLHSQYMNKPEKKALITGVTGQDGSYLAEFLLDNGYEVHGLIRRTSLSGVGRISRLIAEFGAGNGRGRFSTHHGDLADYNSLLTVMKSVKPDEIYHLGAMSDVRISFDMPEYTSNVTGLGTLRIIEAVRSAGLIDSRIYFASSSEVFGKSVETPQKETTPFHPRSPYGVAKVYGHWVAKNYREAYGMFISCGILFNHESPRRGENFVTRKITKGVANILAGKQDKIYLGNLEARRDWGYAPDYVEAMWKIIQHKEPDDFVVATGEVHSIKEFLAEAFKYSGLGDWQKYVEIKREFYRPSEADILLGDSSKARNLLGWQPKVTFIELVHIMVDADKKEAGSA